jgi:uncharacterized protein (TIGR02246 family)
MDDATAVREAAATLVAAFGEGRLEDYFACFAPDATFVFHSTPQRLKSREAYVETWSRWVAEGQFRVLACESSHPLVQLLGPDVALFIHDVRSVVSTTAGVQELRERETIVFRREPNGSWRALHEHLSPAP